MFNQFRPTLVLMSLLAMIASCEDSLPERGDPNEDLYGIVADPIINGTRVTGDGRLSTVVLTRPARGGGYETGCSGTLITQNYVLTAAHCILGCDYSPLDEDYQKSLGVGIGQSVTNLIAHYEVEAIYTYDGFICTYSQITNDIALMKLRTPVPTSVAVATPPLRPDIAITPSNVYPGMTMDAVGFGRTHPDIPSTGTKHEVTLPVRAICPRVGTQTGICQSWQVQGMILLDTNRKGVCYGDSGGPIFYTKDGIEYVVGVSAVMYGECANPGSLSGWTLVSGFYDDFIAEIVTDLIDGEPEICDDGIDNNGNGLVDCDDPWCFSALHCRPEICDNGKDDNGNGLVDCDDPQCADALNCQPEICNDGIDNNGNGFIDCRDIQCIDSIYCQPEICDDGIDNNANGLVDCDDPACADALNCQPEICNDGVDNNANGLVDCDDPQCANNIHCQPEICNDGIDNNGNGLVDCNDPQCASSIHCQPEICNDGIDNNGNGLIDCADPACDTHETCIKTPDTSGGSCATMPLTTPHSRGLPWIILLGTLGLGTIKAKRRTAPHKK